MGQPVRTEPKSRRARMHESLAPLIAYFNGPYTRFNEQPGMANFAVGNPQDMAMPDYVSSLRRHLEPKDPHWFGYKFSEPEARRTVAEGLSHATGMAWEPNDVAMTNGGFGALAVALRSVVDPGDEVIYLSPPWFFYELLTLAAGGEPVPVPLRPPRFDVDLGLVESAITDRTRAIIFNNPQNPSGRVYPRESIISMSEMLIAASERVGHPLWVISDEPYKKILFDGSEFHSPAEHYPHTLVAYSYGKTLLAPGQRIGYLTVPPSLPEAQRATLRQEIFVQQTATGYAFPNALLQHALPELEQLSIDVGVLEKRRDRLVPALREMGYEASMPEGTFYVMARSPIADDALFAEVLGRHGVLVLPGTIVETPGWFRISLTASDEMVDDGIPRFATALDEVRGHRGDA